MKLFSEIRQAFQCCSMSVSERFNTVEASFTTTLETLPNKLSIQSLFSLIPTRDKLTLTLKTDSGDIIHITNNRLEELDFSPFTEILSKQDNIDVQIQIDKTVLEGRFSIYDFNSFTNDLLSRKELDIIKWFSERLKQQEYLMFEVFDYDISFSTRTIAFESNEIATFKPKVNRGQRLSACKECAYFYNMNAYEVIPDDFIIEGVMRAGECLEPLFGKLATIFSLVYVSSSASFNDNSLNIQISGQRTTIHEVKLNEIKEDQKWMSLYSWIYTDGNPTDKSLIAHNVISLYCKYEKLLNIDSTVFEAIKTNYNLYLRNNVTQYLDMKREIAKFIQNVVTQVGDYAVTILGKFKTNLLAIFGFLFTVVLTRIGSTQKWEDIFTKHTIYLLEIFVIGSLVYLIICIFEMRYKLNKTKQGYFELKNNYKDILSETELTEAFNDDKLLNKNIKTANKGMIAWSLIWGFLLIISVIIIEVLTVDHGVFVWLWNNICNG